MPELLFESLNFLCPSFLLDFDTIDKIVADHLADPAQRYGQKRLAAEVVAVIFGKEAVKQAENISEVLF